MSSTPNIVLVGLPAAGKSMVGEALARRLGRPFVDSDEEIESRTGFRIRELFESDGEPGFRALEQIVVAELVAGHGQVIALGGGAFESELTRSLVLRTCLAVWLDPPFETIVERLRTSSARPLLDGNEPEALLCRLAAERRPHYREAHLRITKESAAAAVAAIEKRLPTSFSRRHA